MALEYEGPSLVQRANEEELYPTVAGDPRGCSNVVTVAADGGPVFRRTLTVVTHTFVTFFIIETRTSNISRVEALANIHAIFLNQTGPTRYRFSAGAGIYTRGFRE